MSPQNPKRKELKSLIVKKRGKQASIWPEKGGVTANGGKSRKSDRFRHERVAFALPGNLGKESPKKCFCPQEYYSQTERGIRV